MKKYFSFLALLTLFISCKKEAGEGGKASISGRLWLKEYNSNFSSLQLERDAYDEYIYIQYGEDISYGDRIKTTYDGRFEFKYLRPGKYKVFTYSKDPTDKDNVKPTVTMVVMNDVEIVGKKDKIELDTMVIYN